MERIGKGMGAALRGLVVFGGLLRDELVSSLAALLDSPAGDAEEGAQRYAAFARVLFARGDDLSVLLLEAVLDDESLLIRRIVRGEKVGEPLRRCAEEELKLLERVSMLDGAALREAIGYHGYLPVWETARYDFVQEYRRRLDMLGERGYGIFAKHTAFVLEDGKLIPVRNPDPITLEQLPGYERERAQVESNTAALLEGKPAANVLLYGDAGTGKSSTVKALVNKYCTRGLRLVELRKNQLTEIPALLDLLAYNPLKFILFVDDLSFSEDDDSFSALKAILEGSVAARGANVAIYATSNRRHLVRESFSAREGDEIHMGDTIAELTSLSDRFGLMVTFLRPDKERYLEIVKELACQSRIVLPDEELILRAEAFALRHSGRSPRVARQFIDSLLTLG